MKISFVSLILLQCLLISCGMSNVKVPQNMQELRDSSKKYKSVSVDSYFVKRQFPLIVRDVKKQAKKCFAVSISKRSFVGGQFDFLNLNFHPIVSVTKNKLELSLQLNYGNDVTKPSFGWPKGPAPGYYLLVVDVNRIANKQSKVTTYGAKRIVANLSPSINSWIRGNIKQCPNMLKFNRKPKS